MATGRSWYQTFESDIVIPEYNSLISKKILPSKMIQLLHHHVNQLAHHYAVAGKSNPLTPYVTALEIIHKAMAVLEKSGGYHQLYRIKSKVSKAFTQELLRGLAIASLNFRFSLESALPRIHSKAEHNFFALMKRYVDLVLAKEVRYDSLTIWGALKTYKTTIESYKTKLKEILEQRMKEFDSSRKSHVSLIQSAMEEQRPSTHAAVGKTLVESSASFSEMKAQVFDSKIALQIVQADVNELSYQATPVKKDSRQTTQSLPLSSSSRTSPAPNVFDVAQITMSAVKRTDLTVVGSSETSGFNHVSQKQLEESGIKFHV